MVPEQYKRPALYPGGLVGRSELHVYARPACTVLGSIGNERISLCQRRGRGPAVAGARRTDCAPLCPVSPTHESSRGSSFLTLQSHLSLRQYRTELCCRVSG